MILRLATTKGGCSPQMGNLWIQKVIYGGPARHCGKSRIGECGSAISALMDEFLERAAILFLTKLKKKSQHTRGIYTYFQLQQVSAWVTRKSKARSTESGKD